MPIANYTITLRAYKALAPPSEPRFDGVVNFFKRTMPSPRAPTWAEFEELCRQMIGIIAAISNATHMTFKSLVVTTQDLWNATEHLRGLVGSQCHLLSQRLHDIAVQAGRQLLLVPASLSELTTPNVFLTSNFPIGKAVAFLSWVSTTAAEKFNSIFSQGIHIILWAYHRILSSLAALCMLLSWLYQHSYNKWLADFNNPDTATIFASFVIAFIVLCGWETLKYCLSFVDVRTSLQYGRPTRRTFVLSFALVVVIVTAYTLDTMVSERCILFSELC